MITKINDCKWLLKKHGNMNTDCLLFGSKEIIEGLDPKSIEQISNVACLPGIAAPAMTMPDAHQGYGFPIGGVAAFDPKKGGVVSAGGVGFDIACGVRTLSTGLHKSEILPKIKDIADRLFAVVPSGVGKGGLVNLTVSDLESCLAEGAPWTIGHGYGRIEDLSRIEDKGKAAGADPKFVTKEAKQRGLGQLGSLGSGNHYLELQVVGKIYDEQTAKAFNLNKDEVVISLHCGSRGLGHQIGTDYLALMWDKAKSHGLKLPEKELACAPIHSETGQAYLQAMLCGINYALANRQVITHFVRECFSEFFHTDLKLIYDVSHNTCKPEKHLINGKNKMLFVHRKGATRALGPGHELLPDSLKPYGQPVLIGGSMGTCSYILAGSDTSASESLCSAPHGAGRILSRSKARKQFKGKKILGELEHSGIFVRTSSFRGLAEEAPLAYKDVHEVVTSAQHAGLATIVANLVPISCVKG